MKKAKRWFATAVAMAMLLSCFGGAALAAPGDGGGGGGQGGGGPKGGGGGGNGGGPPQVYLTVELKEGAAFTYGDVTLTLSDAEGAGFVLTSGEEKVVCTSQYEELTEGKWPGVKGIAHLSQLTVTDADNEDALRAMMPQYWAKDKTLILNQDGTFLPIIDVNEAAVVYTDESVKNDASATGYTTTITVSDPEKSYSSVLAYGKWMCSDVTDTEAKAYEPEEWKNGYYYSGYGIRAMSYDESAQAWTLSLDLASANMAVACYANVSEDDLSDVDDPKTTISVPYDAVKQSKSFDWGNTASCAQTGTLTTVDVNDEIKLRVYTPSGYNAADTTTRYPVVYLIAGMMASYDSWLDGGGNANVIFDNLIAKGEVAPTILVAMERNVARMDCFDVWESADDRAKSNGDGDGYINYKDGTAKGSDVANMITSDVVSTVIPYIDANFNTAADAEHRAVIGCSMGGVAASQIWLTDYEMFNFYGFFSGSDMWFKEADDEEADPEYMALRDTYTAAYTTLLNNVAANMDGVKILVGGGITDRNTFGGDQNSSGSDNISAWLTEAGIEHDFEVVGGEHDWASWTQLLDQFAGYLAEDGTTWKVDSSAAPEAKADTTLIVATDRHEFMSEYDDLYTEKTNNLVQVLKAVKAANVVDPSAILLSGDNVGRSGKNSDFPFSLSDIEAEVYEVFDGIDCYYTYGSHDIYCEEGYDGFLSGPQEMDGYYLYGISFSQMQFATEADALAEKEEAIAEGDDLNLDMADPNGISADVASAKFLEWVASLDDNKPIVIGNHIPMHHLRTDNLGGGIWAKALNEAAKSHDIIVIWGHNHTLEEQYFKGNTSITGAGTKDRDYYLVTPGTTVEFPTGEAIPLFDENGEALVDQKGHQLNEYPSESIEINFTYMNAGYLKLGYCSTISFVDNEDDGVYDEMILRRFTMGLGIAGDETGAVKNFGTTGYTSPTTLELAFATDAKTPVEPETPVKPEAPAASETYVVQSGDCLWNIAAKVLGNGAKWKDIYQVNKNIIKNPNLIYAGQKLTLPQK